MAPLPGVGSPLTVRSVDALQDVTAAVAGQHASSWSPPAVRGRPQQRFS
jgi:hypothetical protein